MKILATCLVLLLWQAWAAGPAAADPPPPARPVGVSPGGAHQFLLAAVPCPTFSWTEAERASAYELRVFRVGDLELVDALPALTAELPAGASSWTPAADRCLTPGERYGWSVRVITETDRVRGAWSEALLFEVAVAPADLAALDVLRRYLGPEALAAALEAAASRTAAGLEAAPSAEDQAGLPPTQTSSGAAEQGAGADAIAVRGDVPGGSGMNFGVAGISHSPDGAGVSAENTAGPDLSLAGSPPAEISETAFTRDSGANLSFDFANSGAGTMTLRVDGTDVVTTATDQDTLAALPCVNGEIAQFLNNVWDCGPDPGGGGGGDADTLDGLDSTQFLRSDVADAMTGTLTIDVPAGHALETGDSINLGGNLFRNGVLFLNANAPNNTGLGSNALLANTTGTGNTAVGHFALDSNVGGFGNTALGSYALGSNVSGFGNTAIGPSALYNNTSYLNTAVGLGALVANTSGNLNTAVGASALDSNTAGVRNTALGYAALSSNTTGHRNTALGQGALYANTTGFYNTAVGEAALLDNTTGYYNTAVGRTALSNSSTASFTTALGWKALLNHSTGNSNTALGARSLHNSTTGFSNTAVGSRAIYSNAVGAHNTAVGFQALQSATGSDNIAIGSGTGTGITTGNSNIFIGNAGAPSATQAIAIGSIGIQTQTFIAGIFGATIPYGYYVFVHPPSGKLATGFAASPQDVRDLGDRSEKVLALRPVSFRLEGEGTGGGSLLQFGLLAEEVNEVLPELVTRDPDGRPQSVRYQRLPVLLLSELQKQRAKLEDQEALIRELRARLEAVERRRGLGAAAGGR